VAIVIKHFLVLLETSLCAGSVYSCYCFFLGGGLWKHVQRSRILKRNIMHPDYKPITLI